MTTQECGWIRVDFRATGFVPSLTDWKKETKLVPSTHVLGYDCAALRAHARDEIRRLVVKVWLCRYRSRPGLASQGALSRVAPVTASASPSPRRAPPVTRQCASTSIPRCWTQRRSCAACRIGAGRRRRLLLEAPAESAR